MHKRFFYCTWVDGADYTSIFRIKKTAMRLINGKITIFCDKGVRIYVVRLLRGYSRHRVFQNIRQVYGWLVHTWQPNDRIYVFDFPCGPCITSLCGSFHFPALLPSEHTSLLDEDMENGLIQEAYIAYQQRDERVNKIFQQYRAFQDSTTEVLFSWCFRDSRVAECFNPLGSEILENTPAASIEFHGTRQPFKGAPK